MEYNFNDHTDEVAADGSDPEPTWQPGIEFAFNDWEKWPNAERTSNQIANSPIDWDRDTGPNRMDVGFYHFWDAEGAGDYGFVRFYRSANDLYPATNCSTPMQIFFVRVYLNAARLRANPGWFFETVVRHELGHAFGLCHASLEPALGEIPQNTGDNDYPQYHSVMLLANHEDIIDRDEPGIRIEEFGISCRIRGSVIEV